MNITLGNALTRRRAQLGFSLREAADAVAVITYQQLSKLEKDESFNPSFVVMVGLTLYLGCDMNTLAQYVIASQRKAGTITTGHSSSEVKMKERAESRRANVFQLIHGRILAV